MPRFVSPVAFHALVASAALAGPLIPPAGPVTSTPGPEPRIVINATNTPGDNDASPSTFKITQPGSYYLASNLTGEVGKDGIEVAADNVTIDLNGFTLKGVNGSNTGITAHAGTRAIVIRNGSIADWANRAIDLRGQDWAQVPTAARIADIAVTGASEVAIEIGNYTIVESVCIDGASSGISGGQNNTIRNCVVRVNSSGIDMNAASIIDGCVVRASDTCIIIGGRAGVVRNCTASECSIGISVASGVGNEGVLIQDCAVTAFSNLGITASGGSTARVTGNTISGDASKNPAAGIWAGDQCYVTDNDIRNIRNSGATASGILMQGLGGRTSIRGNTVVNCDKGIKATSGGNAVYANQLSLNTKQFELAANNRVGPIVVGTLSPQIDGNTGGSGMGSTDPNANILY